MKTTLYFLFMAFSVHAQSLPVIVAQADAKVAKLDSACSALSKERVRLMAKLRQEDLAGIPHTIADVNAASRAAVDYQLTQRELQSAYQWDYKLRDSYKLPALPRPVQFGGLRR